MDIARSVDMNDFVLALILALLFMVLFIGGFWLGVNWQIGREKKY